MPVQPDDAYWRRPAGGSVPADPALPEEPRPADPQPENPRPADLTRAGLAEQARTAPADSTEASSAKPVPVRPAGAAPAARTSASSFAATTGPQSAQPSLVYRGPPLTTPPPAGWRPPHVVQPAPPRRLPEQNHSAIDDQEARARALSLGITIVAGAIIMIILCALCGRALL